MGHYTIGEIRFKDDETLPGGTRIVKLQLLVQHLSSSDELIWISCYNKKDSKLIEAKDLPGKGTLIRIPLIHKMWEKEDSKTKRGINYQCWSLDKIQVLKDENNG